VPPGNDQFQAVSASQTISVAKAAQTLAFTALPNTTFSTNGIALDAKASSGLPVAFRLISGAGAISGSTLNLVGVGSFTVAVDQAGNTNWCWAIVATKKRIPTRVAS
jgi:hypothetical protein